MNCHKYVVSAVLPRRRRVGARSGLTQATAFAVAVSLAVVSSLAVWCIAPSFVHAQAAPTLPPPANARAGTPDSAPVTTPSPPTGPDAAGAPNTSDFSDKRPTPQAAPARTGPSGAAPAAAVAEVDSAEGITEYKLANGLHVLLGSDSTKPTVTVNLVYRVGSRHEGPGEAGMAHLLEHMLYKGTAQTPDPKAEFTRRAMRWNGTTSYDRTNYYGQFITDQANLRWIIGWLADTMANVNITAERLDSERTVVLSEMQAAENRPQRVLYQLAFGAAYRFHPYGRAVIGTESDLDHVQASRLQAFYRRFYRPDNAVLLVTGQFDSKAALDEIVRTFGPIVVPPTPVEEPYTLDRVQEGEREVVLRRVGGVPSMSVSYHMPAGATREATALAALADMLTRSPDGLLYQALVQSGKAVSVFGFPVALYDPGILQFGATLADSSQRDQVWNAMRDVLEQPLALTEEALMRTKRDAANELREILESPENLGLRLTDAIALGNWRLFFARRDWIQSLTLDEIKDAGRRWLLRDNRTLAWYLPTEAPRRAPEPERIDPAKSLENHAWQRQEPFTADFALSPSSITERAVTGQLDGGLRYALLPRRTRGERISFLMRLHWGELNALSGRWREADMLGQMMLAGTQRMPRQAFEDRLRELDARLDINADATGADLTLSAAREHFDEALALAADALRRPAFPPELFEERRRRKISALEAQLDQPDSKITQVMRSVDFSYPSDDPRHYRAPREQIADLNARNVEQTADFWRDFAGASFGEFAALGPIEPPVLIAQVRRLFGDWKTPVPYQRITREFHPLPPGERFVETPDKKNAVLLTLERVRLNEDDPDYPALAMAVRLLGADVGSRVARRLREQEGLSYGAYASLNVDRRERSGAISIRAIHAPANRDRLLGALQAELKRTLAEGFEPQELADAQATWRQRRQTTLADENNVVSILADNLYWNDTMARWERTNAQIQALTVSDVNQALRKYLNPDALLVLGAGDYRGTRF